MKRPSWWDRLLGRRLASGREPSASVGARGVNAARFDRFQGASGVNERNVTQGVDWGGLYRDRYDYDRTRVLEEALRAWRLNPLARRIVELQTQYILDGIEFHCDEPGTEQFLQEFWNHPLNRIGERLEEWASELALTGNLFVVLTTDAAGMSYLRIHPTDLIEEIESAPNDVQQERAYQPKATQADPDPKAIPGYWASVHRSWDRPRRGLRGAAQQAQQRPDAALRDRGKTRTVMLHYAVNRLAGMQWGEPDLAPLLPWLARYVGWLEDRVRLNRFRQAYMYQVKGRFASEEERQRRQAELMNNPPMPGSVLVVGEQEEWSVISPHLDSFEANNDGLALKKFIVGGRGYPLHWLAEPESSTRTTAEAAGTPTFKTLEARQRMFLAMIKDILSVVVQRRGASAAGSLDVHERGTPAPCTITVSAADISERDNAALALASTQVVESFGQLWAQGFIDAEEYLRVVYRFAGEVLPAARPDNPQAGSQPRRNPQAGKYLKTDASSGSVAVEDPE